MSSPFRLFRTPAPIGPENGAPGRRAWKQIADIAARAGHPLERDDFLGGLRQFQKGMGLKPDGIVNPGGPTESALNVIAVADKKGGPKLVEAIKPAMRDLSQQGLTFTPDPRNPDALGMWRDGNGHRVDAERAGQILRFAGSGASDLSGPQQILAERLVGRAGRDKLTQGAGTGQTLSEASTGGAPIEGGTGDDILESAVGDDNLRREDAFTSGAARRLAGNIVGDGAKARAKLDDVNKNQYVEGGASEDDNVGESRRRKPRPNLDDGKVKDLFKRAVIADSEDQVDDDVFANGAREGGLDPERARLVRDLMNVRPDTLNKFAKSLKKMKDRDPVWTQDLNAMARAILGEPPNSAIRFEFAKSQFKNAREGVNVTERLNFLRPDVLEDAIGKKGDQEKERLQRRLPRLK